MGKRGPSPTPTAVLAARGSWLAKTRTKEPKPMTRLGAPPARLDAAAKQVWRAAVKELSSMEVGARPDRATLERYCTATIRYRSAVKILLEQGETFSNKGMIRARPEVGIVNQLSLMLLRLEQEFGFTPSARARINVEIEDEDSTPKEKTKARFFAAG